MLHVVLMSCMCVTQSIFDRQELS